MSAHSEAVTPAVGLAAHHERLNALESLTDKIDKKLDRLFFYLLGTAGTAAVSLALLVLNLMRPAH